MAKTIDRLTVEAEALIPVMRDKWITIGLATGPADREAAQAAISDAYRMAGLEPPRIWIWLGSPWAGNIASCILNTVGDPARIWNPVNDPVGNRIWGQLTGELQSKIYDQLLDPVRFQIGQEVGNTIEAQIQAQVGHGVDALVQAQIRDQVLAQDLDQDPSQVWHQIREMIVQEGAHGLRGCWNRSSEAHCGLHDASWLVSYDFFHCAQLIDGTECREPLMRLARVAGWWWPFKGACIITERPTALHRDGAHRLHSADGPGIRYPDGWAVYAWHGTRIPAWLVENKQRLTPDAVEAEGNADVRWAMLEIFGVDRYIEMRGARLLSEDDCPGHPRQLFEIDVKGEPIRVLRLIGAAEDGARDRQFHLGVPLTCETTQQAVAWRDSWVPDDRSLAPLVLKLWQS